TATERVAGDRAVSVSGPAGERERRQDRYQPAHLLRRPVGVSLTTRPLQRLVADGREERRLNAEQQPVERGAADHARDPQGYGEADAYDRGGDGDGDTVKVLHDVRAEVGDGAPHDEG